MIGDSVTQLIQHYFIENSRLDEICRVDDSRLVQVGQLRIKITMSKSVTDLRAIASSGGGMVLDASNFSVTDLCAIASSASGSGARITLRNVGAISTADLRAIASSSSGCVVFDFFG